MRKVDGGSSRSRQWALGVKSGSGILQQGECLPFARSCLRDVMTEDLQDLKQCLDEKSLGEKSLGEKGLGEKREAG